MRPAGVRLSERLKEPGIVSVPGAHDAMAGLLAKDVGFECLYLSGAALSASLGLPDLGVLTEEELIAATKSIFRATGLPLIVDGDTGYGETLNVMRLVRELEDAGAAAVQIEDQVLPKKCGHLSGKHLIPADEMVRKIQAAKRASRNLLIVARTDAAANDIEDALDRARRYAEAGADVIFPEALSSDEEFAAFSKAIEKPLLANMTEFGRTPNHTAADFERLGYKIVIWPVSSLRVAARAMTDLFQELARSGTTVGQLDRMQTRKELYRTIGYAAFEALDETLEKSSLPNTPDTSGEAG
ncbi:MAG: methylisocitrate lyase [Pseudomonadota bacterium]